MQPAPSRILSGLIVVFFFILLLIVFQFLNVSPLPPLPYRVVELGSMTKTGYNGFAKEDFVIYAHQPASNITYSIIMSGELLKVERECGRERVNITNLVYEEPNAPKSQKPYSFTIYSSHEIQVYGNCAVYFYVKNEKPDPENYEYISLNAEYVAK